MSDLSLQRQLWAAYNATCGRDSCNIFCIVRIWVVLIGSCLPSTDSNPHLHERPAIRAGNRTKTQPPMRNAETEAAISYLSYMSIVGVYPYIKIRL